MIASKVPEGQHFDESAIVNEGGWLTVQHLESIETALAEVSVLNDTINSANTTIGEHVATIATLNTQVETLEATNVTNTERIQALEAEIAALGNKSSGGGTTLPVVVETTTDKTVVGKSQASNPDSPLNIAAKQYMESKKKVR